MKKLSIIIVVLISISTTANSFTDPPTRKCTVSSTPANNDKHCRLAPDGSGDDCFPEGFGPACDGTDEPAVY